jgi:hypothetical protein
MLISHRVVRHCGDHLITQGDSTPHEDEPMFEEHVLGRVVAIERAGRPVDPRPVWWKLAMGRVLAGSAFALWVAMGVHRRLNKAGEDAGRGPGGPPHRLTGDCEIA